MDRFSKTTEIDLSEIAPIEDGTPQKSRIGKIIALVLCVITAIFIWMFVMETDMDIQNKTVKNVGVYSAVTQSDPVATANITVSGLRKHIIDFKSEDFKLIQSENGYTVVLQGEKANKYSCVNESTADEVIVSVNLK